MYEYKCVVRRIVDGDTVDVDIDLGFDTWIFNQRIRLAGINAPEIRTRDDAEKVEGYRAMDFVKSKLALSDKVILLSKEYNGEKGKYGRIIGDFQIYHKDAWTTLSSALLSEGLAVEVSY